MIILKVMSDRHNRVYEIQTDDGIVTAKQWQDMWDWICKNDKCFCKVSYTVNRQPAWLSYLPETDCFKIIGGPGQPEMKGQKP